MAETVLIVGSGSAGLLAALSLKRQFPNLAVTVIRSPEIGVIGVGEGTTPTFPAHIFNHLGISRRRFYELTQPTWKLGGRFLWGPRRYFDYTFSEGLDAHWSDMSRPNGYYCNEEFGGHSYAAAFMEHGKVFPRQKGGAPAIQEWHAFHIENQKFVAMLETLSRENCIEFLEGKVIGVERDASGVSAVLLEDGRRLAATLFIDASGFRSELLGRTLEEPFVSYNRSLFCDRAIIGGWDRTNEPILPYTTAETMNAGWAWQIEHEHFINRGYVYSSDAISDEAAAAEFLERNPKVSVAPRALRFRSGRYQRMWVDNVIAIGNAGGFVEPLEATALMIACLECQKLVAILQSFGLRPAPTVRELFNRKMAVLWDDTRDFLALHYRFNTRLNTPFWTRCREETDVSGLEDILDYYRENGPTGFGRYLLRNPENPWGIEGYLVMLVGNRAPHEARYIPTTEEAAAWKRHLAQFAETAKAAMDVKEALAWIRHPDWRWNEELRKETAPNAVVPNRGGLAGVVRA